ncbi:MAG: AMP-dependent synthetase [Anaerolineales bacterium]|nr:long-chain fatty acid--CoA ligase [Anaerolineae bacterium]PWB56902.1 MAG: AMP-dependent synthetase [Anaerolineales bacterium]
MHERPWLKSYDPLLPQTLEPYPDRTLLEVLSETVQKRPDHLTLIFKGLHVNATQLEAFANDFAAALIKIGVKKGDIVAALIPNSPQAVISQIGAWKAGAIFCPINATYTEYELEHALNECEAETVVVLNPFYDKVKSVQPRTKVKRVIATHIKDFLPPVLALLFTLVKEKKEGYRIDVKSGDYVFADLLKSYKGSGRPSVEVKPADPAILLFSGGTTGKPKAVLATHRSLLISAMQLHAYAATVLSDWDDRLTLVMPLFHVYGNMGMNTSLVARYPMVIVPNPRDIDDLIATLRKERPAVLHGVPTLFNALLNHPEVISGKVDFKSMKVCYSAAAPLLKETKDRFEKLTNGRLLDAYAMTETVLAAVVCPAHGENKEGSTGLPLPDVDLKIVDMETGQQELPPNVPGEIAIRAPQIMEGYWKRPEETALMIHDGWVYTGDIGYLDEDGYLFLIDRKKDVIKPSGFQVWPREVEEVIAMHPAVQEVCVGGVIDEQTSEAVKAWVVVKPGVPLDAETLRAFCREKLSGYKVPKHVEFRSSLPKNMVGKHLRRVLVEENSSM